MWVLVKGRDDVWLERELEKSFSVEEWGWLLNPVSIILTSLEDFYVLSTLDYLTLHIFKILTITFGLFVTDGE